MDYVIVVNQVGVVRSGLADKTDLVDWAIINYVARWILKRERACKILIRDEEFIWIDYGTLLKELPLLGIKSKSVLSRRITKLCELGLLDAELKGRSRIYLRPTDLAIGVMEYREVEQSFSSQRKDKHNTSDKPALSESNGKPLNVAKIEPVVASAQTSSIKEKSKKEQNKKIAIASAGANPPPEKDVSREQPSLLDQSIPDPGGVDARIEAISERTKALISQLSKAYYEINGWVTTSYDHPFMEKLLKEIESSPDPEKSFRRIRAEMAIMSMDDNKRKKRWSYFAQWLQGHRERTSRADQLNFNPSPSGDSYAQQSRRSYDTNQSNPRKGRKRFPIRALERKVFNMRTGVVEHVPLL